MHARRIQKLFERYRDRGDGAALAAVFDACASRLFALACHLVHEPAQAEDLVQSTFLAVIAHPQRYDGSAPLEAWLYGILWREAQKARRQAARRVDPRELAGTGEPGPAEALAAEELPAAVREALGRLPAHEREVLEPFLLEDERAGEIARRLGRSAGTVRSQIHRALERLRRELPASLTPLAGVLPIRGLSAVRAEVLGAAGVPAGAMAAVAGGGFASRIGIGVAALVLGSGGWVALRIALGPSTAAPRTVVRLESEDSVSPPRQPAVVPVASERTPVPAGGARLALSVVNWPKEEAVVGLRVELWPRVPGESAPFPNRRQAGEQPVAAGVLDARGQLELDLPVHEPLRIELPAQEGTFNELSGSPVPFEGKCFDLESLEPGQRKALRMQVLFGREFSHYGRVVADEDGQPITGARVLSVERSLPGDAASVFATDAGNRARWLEAGADGAFELQLTYEQQFLLDLAILAPGRTPLLTRDRGGASRESPTEYRLLRTAALHGRVLGESSQSGARYRVRLSTRPEELCQRGQSAYWMSEESGPSWTTDCDPDGRFEVLELPAQARLDVKVLRGDAEVLWINGQGPDAPRLDPGESRTVEWIIRSGTKVTGVAFDKNLRPVPRCGIWLLQMVIAAVIDPGPVAVLISDDDQMVVARTHADEQGRFEFENVQPGTWWVGIRPPPNDMAPEPGNPVIPLAVQFELRKDVPAVQIDIRPRNTLPIRGKVLKPDGTPLADAGIYVFKTDDSGPERGRSGPDGSFEIVPNDEGVWKLKAWAPDQGFADSRPVEARAGQTGVTLQMATGTKLSGLVVGSGPEDHGAVELRVYVGDSVGYGAIESKAGDAFDYGPLPAGRHDLFAICKPDRIGLVRGVETKVGAETRDVRVELGPAAVLSVHYSGKAEARYFEVLVADSLVHWPENATKTESSRVLVPPGVVKLRPEAGGAERVYTVRAGTETVIELDDS